MLGSIIPLDTDCGNAAERSKQIAIFGVCLREYNLRNIQKSRGRLCELTSEFLSHSADESCFTKNTSSRESWEKNNVFHFNSKVDFYEDYALLMLF